MQCPHCGKEIDSPWKDTAYITSIPFPTPEVMKEHNEAVRKLDALDGEIRYNLRPKTIQNALSDYFKLTPNWAAKYNRQFLEWAVEAEISPEQVKAAADLWRQDKRFNWSAPTLRGIQEHWLELRARSVEDKIAAFVGEQG